MINVASADPTKANRFCLLADFEVKLFTPLLRQLFAVSQSIDWLAAQQNGTHDKRTSPCTSPDFVDPYDHILRYIIKYPPLLAGISCLLSRLLGDSLGCYYRLVAAIDGFAVKVLTGEADTFTATVSQE